MKRLNLSHAIIIRASTSQQIKFSNRKEDRNQHFA